jgi:hypothetical protein
VFRPQPHPQATRPRWCPLRSEWKQPLLKEEASTRVGDGRRMCEPCSPRRCRLSLLTAADAHNNHISTQAWAASGECKNNPLYMLGDPGKKNGQCMWACKVRWRTYQLRVSGRSVERRLTMRVVCVCACVFARAGSCRAAEGMCRPLTEELRGKRLHDWLHGAGSRGMPECLDIRTRR